MRLTCPNCDAQYEVPDAVVPLAGRDVQCSNCGDTWFQHHPDNTPEDGAEDGVEDTFEDEQSAELEPENTDAASMPPEQPHQKRELDPSVTDVLREEAEREAEARMHDSGGLEEQPDLGLAEPDDEASRRQREADQRMVRMRGEDAAAPVAAAAKATTGSRRDVLPDIDEINSTLRKDGSRQAQGNAAQPRETATPKPKGNGFLRGIVFILILAVLLLLLYIFAPQISAAVPALSSMLDSYVAAVDGARLWLDGQVRSLMGSLDGMSTEGAESTEAPAETPLE